MPGYKTNVYILKEGAYLYLVFANLLNLLLSVVLKKVSFLLLTFFWQRQMAWIRATETINVSLKNTHILPYIYIHNIYVALDLDYFKIHLLSWVLLTCHIKWFFSLISVMSRYSIGDTLSCTVGISAGHHRYAQQQLGVKSHKEKRRPSPFSFTSERKYLPSATAP